VTASHELPESLRKLVEAWRRAGATREEILHRLDQLELLAHEERLRLVELATAPAD
jgi:hypothetical protein